MRALLVSALAVAALVLVTGISTAQDDPAVLADCATSYDWCD
ncbi:hypothetical protein LX16_1073 [Stackebrandtia albiflava]|uniref:Uncharacterized protein n=1 Tax=Stackebrandtia albiflava TaxID=406432 RepID=A0A562VBX9_9ACTN|nr:hypothetical protein [Stackebrandtia albiflava]TWJ15370.1 hypothetical protein LX16_1073 [Stackebrandtia albiflava]